MPNEHRLRRRADPAAIGESAHKDTTPPAEREIFRLEDIIDLEGDLVKIRDKLRATENDLGRTMADVSRASTERDVARDGRVAAIKERDKARSAFVNVVTLLEVETGSLRPQWASGLITAWAREGHGGAEVQAREDGR